MATKILDAPPGRTFRYRTLSLTPEVQKRLAKHRDRHGTTNQRFVMAMLDLFETLKVDQQAALIRGELDSKKK